MIQVLITGANGQLASCIKPLALNHPNINFIYTDYLELDICDFKQLNTFFQENNQIDYCINCAAYTNVDKAETDTKQAFQINAEGSKNLAKVCALNNTTLIHVSTDFVFDGQKNQSYNELDKANPISLYGETKLKGETEIINNIDTYFIIRTSWLYSEHGNNFMKTMLRLAESYDEINVVSDQIGVPTYAGDLAQVILKFITENNITFGIYHYSNEGVASWYDFAKAIFDISNVTTQVNPIKTEAYPLPAKRPKFSVMDKTKIKETIKIEIPYWRDSLKKVIKKYNE